MTIRSEEVAAGKCYLSNMNFVRHVVSIDGEEVTFEERGTKPIALPWETKEPVSVQVFADDVTGIVAQDFDPEEPTPIGSVQS